MCGCHLRFTSELQPHGEKITMTTGTGTGYGDYVTLVPGMDVYASDGDKVGTIRDATEQSITVEKGFFFPKDYIIPISAVAGVDENDRVYLLVDKESALSERWDTGMATETVTTTTTGMTATDTVDTTETDVTRTSDTAATRVPVYEEDLTAVK